MFRQKSDDEKFLEEFVAGSVTGFIVSGPDGGGGTLIKTGEGYSPGALIIWRNKADAMEFAGRRGNQSRVKEVSFEAANDILSKTDFRVVPGFATVMRVPAEQSPSGYTATALWPQSKYAPVRNLKKNSPTLIT